MKVLILICWSNEVHKEKQLFKVLDRAKGRKKD